MSFELIHPDDRERSTATHLDRGGTDQTLSGFENRMLCRDGSYRWLSWTARFHGDYFYAIARDITESKQQQEELATLAADLKRSNEELEQFAYVASHDLQAPLRRIVQFSQMLQEALPPEFANAPGCHRFVTSIRKSATTLIEQINELLSFSRAARSILVEDVDLTLLLKQITDSLAETISRHDGKVLYGQLPVVRGTRGHLAQVLQNLIENALKHRVSEVPPIVEVKVLDDRSHWLVSVADNGEGISEDQRQRVFKIFQRLSPDKSAGHGIGLSTCKKIVEAYGGSIWVESNQPRGSVLKFTLPKNPMSEPHSRRD